ncbi:MAG: MFS transporter [Candidatus Bathyarchaeota archaeon]|nr:MFS transporter [Candidatus Bathyarchaeota archaeon]
MKNPVFMKIYAIPLLTVMVQSMSGAIAILYALDLGANVLQVNLITTIRSTMGIFLMVPFGILSDRFGRKPMVLYSRIVTLLGTVMRAFATEPNHLIIASLFGGFAGGGFFPILLTMIGDVAEPEERQEAISTLFFFSSLGLMIGPAICTGLLLLPQITMRNIYQITSIANVGILIYLAFTIRETKSQTHEKGNSRLHISNLIKNSNFQGLLTMSFLYFFSRSVVQTYVPIYASVDLQLSNAEVASFSFYRSLAIMLIRLSSATFLIRLSTRPFLISVLLLGGITSLVSPFANNYILIVVIFFLSGLSYGATSILGSTLVSNISTPENRGIANSLYNLAQSTGNITKLVTSPIADIFGLTYVFFFGGLMGLLSAIPPLFKKIGK